MSKPDLVKVVIRLSPDKYLLRDDTIVKNDETSIKKLSTQCNINWASKILKNDEIMTVFSLN